MLWLMNALKSAMFVQSYDGRNLIKLENQKVCQVSNGVRVGSHLVKTTCKNGGYFGIQSHETKCRRLRIIF